MNSIALRAAIWLVRRWTDFYTCRLAIGAREARRAEIASDVWHMLHDPDQTLSGRLAFHMVLRVLLGIPDDIVWRCEQMKTSLAPRTQAALAGCVLGLFVLAVTAPISRPPAPIVPPQYPRTSVTAYPPPAPPPPPTNRATESRQVASALQFGQASYTVGPNAVAPIKIKDVRPVYPPIAISHNVEGVVVLQARITDAGRVADARIIESASLLNQAAIDAVRQWQFAAADPSGPAEKVLTVRVRFARPERRDIQEGK